MEPKSESEPFLGVTDSECGHKAGPSKIDFCHACSKRNRVFTIRASLVHLCILVSYTLIFFGYCRRETMKPRLLQDTIRDLDIQVKSTPYVGTSDSLYTGPPSMEVDYAWHQLLGNMSIRVTDDELSRNGNRQESIALPEGGGQMVWLGAFHQLHCLKKLRRLNYPQIYATNRTTAEALDLEVHMDHCVELIRQSIMCNPDTSLTTFEWLSSSPKPVLRIDPYERKCVDWEAFMKGILPRVVSSREVDGLVNPKLT